MRPIWSASLIDARKGLDEEAEALILRQACRGEDAEDSDPQQDRPGAEGRLLALAQTANDKAQFEATFMISALKGDGVADLKTWLAEHMPPSPWLYPADQMSDAPLRQLAAEITREKLFERLHQELPYHVDGRNRELEGAARRRHPDRADDLCRARKPAQDRARQGRATIKAIGEAARSEIAEIAEAKVHLFLFVKVREGWGDDPERYRAMGLEFPKD